MKRFGKKVLSVLVGGAMLVSAAPVAAGAAEAPKAGTPYTESGAYDVNVEHVIVNQVMGAGDDAEFVSHSFIELYNPTEVNVSLSGWYIYYKSSEKGSHAAAWEEFALSGSIEAGGYYLIRCGEVDEVLPVAWLIPAGDAEWEGVQLNNKGLSVALTSQRADLSGLSGELTEANRPAGYVDMLAVQGNDEEDDQIPPAYEGKYGSFQSKKKAVRRDNFADTDNNKDDVAELNYEDVASPDEKPVQNSAGETVAKPPYTVKNDGYEADAALGIEKKGGIALGEANEDGGVAEIVAYNADNGKAYVVNGQESQLNIFDVKEDGTFGEKQVLDIAALMKDEDETFEYGDMTSVAVDTQGDRIAVALQDADYTKPGRVAVLDYENNITAVYTTGVQPDMVTFAGNGRYILTADEGEPREGYGAGAVDPEGSVTVIDTQKTDGAVTVAGFEAFDSADLAEQGVIFNKPDGSVLAAEKDLEPEYIAVNGNTAYISLQEANAVAVLDIAAGEITAVYPLGFKDLSEEKNAIDLDDSDFGYDPKTYPDTYGVYMPDALAVYEAGGKTYILTANEGDAREWGSFIDEAEETLTASDGSEAKDVRVLDKSVKAGLEEDKNYLFGGRSFSIFEATDDGLVLVYDSANQFEEYTFSYLPNYYNASNNNTVIDDRSAKKGTEPEAVILAETGGRMYAFIALERIGGIMVYDVTDPADARYINYVNSRDFNEALGGDVAPEGLAIAGKGDKTYLLAAFEVSGTVASYELTAAISGQPGGGEEDPGSDNEEQPGTGNEGQSGDDSGSGCNSAVFAGAGVLSAAALGAAVLLSLKRRRS